VGVRVVRADSGCRLVGDGPVTESANRWFGHLESRNFAAATVRGYAFDVLNFGRFLTEKAIPLGGVGPQDVFDWVEWQARPLGARGQRVVSLASKRGPAPATMNRRIAAVRGLFEFMVMSGDRETNPVPSPRRSSGLRRARSGLLGHVGGRRPTTGGRLIRQDRPLPESLPADDVDAFLADLGTRRDRAIVLLMLLGGLRSAEVRSLRLADVDMGMRQVLVTGKGTKQRLVPVERSFFAELSGYLRFERPKGLATPECFVVLRGPTRGQAMTEAGMRRIFRTHRRRSGATRVRPHRLRHTFGTELAQAGIDLLVLRDLMGHAHAETTAGYIHLSDETISAEWARAKRAMP
jgi:integrase/recombinase XerC